MSGRRSNSAVACSIRAATVSGRIRLGVPPPKKIELEPAPAEPRRFPGQLRAQGGGEARLGMSSRTWLLKSQYGHFARQNGQWT